MSASEYDDTAMTPDEFEEAMGKAVQVNVSNLGDHLRQEVATASTAVTRFEEVRLAGSRDRTITETLVLADT